MNNLKLYFIFCFAIFLVVEVVEITAIQLSSNSLVFISIAQAITTLMIVSWLFYRIFNTRQKQKELQIQHRVLIDKITHEIRTPLHSITGILKLIQTNRIPQHLRSEKLLAGQTAAQYIEQILVLFQTSYQLIGDDLILNPKHVYLSDIINSTQVIFNIPDSILIETDVEDISFFTDEALFRGIAFNLISNALKYADTTIGIQCKVENGVLTLAIGNDTHDDNEPTTFTPTLKGVYKRDKTYSRIRGEGLGLANVNDFATKLNGTFTIARKGDWVFAVLLVPTIKQKIY